MVSSLHFNSFLVIKTEQNFKSMTYLPVKNGKIKSYTRIVKFAK